MRALLLLGPFVVVFIVNAAIAFVQHDPLTRSDRCILPPSDEP